MNFRRYNYIYYELTEGKIDNPLGLIAYGIYKNKKIQFIDNWRREHPNSADKGPSEEILEEFTRISNQHTDIYKEQAEIILEKFCNAVMAQRLDEFFKAEKTSHEEAVTGCLNKILSEQNVSIGKILTNTEKPTIKNRLFEYSFSGIVGTFAFLITVIIFIKVIKVFTDDPTGAIVNGLIDVLF